MAFINTITVKFSIPGAQSLKEKRSRIRRLKDTWGKLSHVALAETGYQDQWQLSEWTFVCIANDQKIIDKTFANIEEAVQSGMDVVLLDVQFEQI